MFVDLIIFTVLILFVVLFYKRLDSVVYFIVIVDIFLKIMRFIAINLKVPELKLLLVKYLPSDLLAILTINTSKLVSSILSWIVLFVYVIFLVQLIKIFIKKVKV